MAERKVVGRKIAIVLSLVCVILAVGLVIALVAYVPTAAQISSLNAQITEKDQAIAALNLQITSLQNNMTSQSANAAQVKTLQTEIANLQAEIADLSNVLYLNATGILVSSQTFDQGPSTNVTIWDGSTPLAYAGYVTVQVQSSSNTTYVELSYSSLGVVYDNVVTLGSGIAAFPVLPGSVAIVLGNSELTDRVTGTVAAMYYY